MGNHGGTTHTILGIPSLETTFHHVSTQDRLGALDGLGGNYAEQAKPERTPHMT